MANGRYRVDIDTRLEVGSLTYADLLLPGERRDEILISTYVCHPSMANNELSGPVVTTELANYLRSLPNRRYTYRIVFAPETIGALTYLHLNFELLKQRVRAAFNVTCVGDDRTYSFLQRAMATTKLIPCRVTYFDTSTQNIENTLEPEGKR